MLPDATVRYADHADGVIDLHLPAGEATRLVVYLHGGFWKAAWDRRHARSLARAQADEGCLVASPEYRRVGGGGGWPTTGEDVLAALTQLPELLRGLDLPVPSTTVVAGHSAGGHLALWLAAQGVTADRFVPLAPVCDLGEADRLGLGDDATAALLGGQETAVADPMVLLPDPPPAPIVIVHGEEDDVVPLSLSRGFVRQHPAVELREVPGDHSAVIEPDSVAWTTVRDAVLA